MAKQNLFIFVADSLRYDHLPESIAREGSVLKSLAPSLHTPVAFSSLVTGKSPEKHSVRGFSDVLGEEHQTIFDKFSEGSFYDNELDPVRKNVLRNTPEAKELEEMEPPFVYVERAMDTHIPYGEIGHGNELLKHMDGEPADVRELENLKEKYREGVESVEKHFWDHVEKLEKLGLREDTLIVFASDHGELLGERVNMKKRFAHSHPMAKELVEVPIVFLEEEIESDFMRLIDIPDTALSILGKDFLNEDGIDVTKAENREGRVIVEGYGTFDNEWKFSDRKGWIPKNKVKMMKDILIQDLKILRGTNNPNSGYEQEESEIEDIDI